jgi:cardiolipin synthase
LKGRGFETPIARRRGERMQEEQGFIAFTPEAGRPDAGPCLAQPAAPFARRLGRELGVCLEPGHRLELVCNGRVFDAMEQLIGRARFSVHLAQYIWRQGAASERIIGALLERARAGVACRVLLDSVGGRGCFKHALLARLEAGGCEARLFHPLVRPSLRQAAVRNHRKLLVVDGQAAITGGWCVADCWLGDGQAWGQWRDTNLLVRGPAVAGMQEAFERTWVGAGGRRLTMADYPPAAPAGGSDLAAFVPSDGRPEASGERFAHLLIESARRRLWLASGYFVPDDRLIDLLAGRVMRGADVRLLVPGPIHDVPLVRLVQRSSYPQLLEAGVRIWEYQPSMMHSKVVLADDWLCAVGSLNLDPQALNVLAEGSLAVASPGLAAQLERDLLADFERSREITRSRSPRSPLSRIARRLRNACYRLGHLVR